MAGKANISKESEQHDLNFDNMYNTIRLTYYVEIKVYNFQKFKRNIDTRKKPLLHV